MCPLLTTILTCSLTIHTVSAHFNDSEHTQNNLNPGVGVTFQLSSSKEWTHDRNIGTYYNSIRRESFYAADSIRYHIGSYASVGIFGGLVTGYRIAPVIPFAGPMLSIPLTSKTSAEITYVPAVGSYNKAVIHLSFSTEL